MPRRGMLDHATCARRHAVRRLRQRFKVDMTVPQLLELERRITAGAFRWLTVRGRQAIVYEVPIDGVVTFPLFSIELWAIVTFLPPATWSRISQRRSA